MNQPMTEQERIALVGLLWREGEIDYLFHDAQEKIFDSIKTGGILGDELVLLCSRRFGKSFFCCIYAMMLCLKNDGFKVAIIAPSKEDASTITMPIFDELLVDAPKEVIKRARAKNTITCGNRSYICVAGADTAGESIRGKGFDLVICEETGAWNPHKYEYTMKSIIRPTLLHSTQPIKVIHATTPSAKYVDHPLHTKVISNKHVIKLTIYDNPLLTISQIEKEKEEQGGEDSFSWRTEYLCEIVRNTNFTCLPDFNRDVHVLAPDEPLDLLYKVGSFDLGGTRDKSAYCEAVMMDGVIHIHEFNLWEPMTDIETMSTYLKERDPNDLVGDVTSQSTIEFNKQGLSFKNPSKTHFETMLIELNKAFRKGEITIDPSLTHLIECCEAATFNTKRTDFERTERFGHADAIASLNYLYRMKKLFSIEEKRRNQAKKLEYNPNTTSIVRAAKERVRRKKQAEGFKFNRKNT